MSRNYNFKKGQAVKGVFPEEDEPLIGIVTDTTRDVVIIQWEGYTCPHEYDRWQFEFIQLMPKNKHAIA